MSRNFLPARLLWTKCGWWLKVIYCYFYVHCVHSVHLVHKK